MANMQKPILANPSPFDAGLEYIIKFNYTGDQIVKKELEITDSDSGEKKKLVSESRTLSFAIPAGTLSNGRNYYASLTVYNIDNASVTSDTVYFMCLTTPHFAIKIPTDGQDIKNSYVDVSREYSQAQGEALNAFEFVLYDNNMSILSRSGIIYVANLGDGRSLGYTFTGLNNKSQFKLKAIGRTKNGMALETTVVSFYTDYISTSGFSAVFATNDSITGNITVTSHFIAIDGKYNGTPKYIDSSIDLGDGNPLIYDEGFEFEGDFALQILFSGGVANIHCDVPIIKINNEAQLIVRRANIYGENAGKYFVTLEIGKTIKYVIFSEYILPTSSWLVTIKRISDFYSISAKEVLS